MGPGILQYLIKFHDRDNYIWDKCMGRNATDVGKHNSVGEAEVIALSRGTPTGDRHTACSEHPSLWFAEGMEIVH